MLLRRDLINHSRDDYNETRQLYSDNTLPLVPTQVWAQPGSSKHKSTKKPYRVELEWQMV